MADSVTKLGNLISTKISGSMSNFAMGMKGSFMSANPTAFTLMSKTLLSQAKAQKESDQRRQGFEEERAAEAKKAADDMFAVTKNMAASLDAIAKDVKAILELMKKPSLLENLTDWIKNLFAGLAGKLTGAVDKLVKFLKEIPDKIGKVFDEIVDFFKKLPGRISSAFDELVDFFKTLPARISGVFDSLMKFIKSIPDNVAKFFKGIIDALDEFTNKYFPKTRAAIAKFFSDIADIFKFDNIKKIFDDNLAKLKNIFNFDELGKVISTKFNNLVKILNESDIAKAFRRLNNIFALSFAQYADELEGLFNKKLLPALESMKVSIGSIGTRISEVIDGAIDSFKTSSIAKLGDDLGTKITDAFGSVINYFRESKVATLAQDIGNIVTGLFTDIRSMIKLPDFGTFFDLGKAATSFDELKYILGEGGIIEKATALVGNFVGTVGGFFSKIFSVVGEVGGKVTDLLSGPLKFFGELTDLTPMFKALGSLTKILGPIGVIFSVIDGLVAAFDTETLAATLGKATGDVKWKDRIAGFFGGVIGGVFGLFDLIADWMGMGAQEGEEGLQKKVTRIATKLTADVFSGIGNLIDLFVGIFTLDLSKIKAAGSNIYDLFDRNLTEFANWIKTPFVKFGNVIIDSMEMMSNWLIDQLNKLPFVSVNKVSFERMGGGASSSSTQATPAAPAATSTAPAKDSANDTSKYGLTNAPVVRMGADAYRAGYNQNDLKRMGLNIKEGDVQKPGAKIEQSTVDGARYVQTNVKGVTFTGFNDNYHDKHSPSSAHTKGLAFDFVVPPNLASDNAYRKSIATAISRATGGRVIDEYAFPSAKSTGGHFHVDFIGKKGVELGTGFFEGDRPSSASGTEVIPRSVKPGEGYDSYRDDSSVSVGVGSGKPGEGYDSYEPYTVTIPTDTGVAPPRQSVQSQTKYVTVKWTPRKEELEYYEAEKKRYDEQKKYRDERASLENQFYSTLENSYKGLLEKAVGPMGVTGSGALQNAGYNLADKKLAPVFDKVLGPQFGGIFSKLAGSYMNEFINEMAPSFGIESGQLNRALNNYASGNKAAAIEDLIYGLTGIATGPRSMIGYESGLDQTAKDLATLTGNPFSSLFHLGDSSKIQEDPAIAWRKKLDQEYIQEVQNENVRFISNLGSTLDNGAVAISNGISRAVQGTSSAPSGIVGAVSDLGEIVSDMMGVAVSSGSGTPLRSGMLASDKSYGGSATGAYGYTDVAGAKSRLMTTGMNFLGQSIGNYFGKKLDLGQFGSGILGRMTTDFGKSLFSGGNFDMVQSIGSALGIKLPAGASLSDIPGALNSMMTGKIVGMGTAISNMAMSSWMPNFARQGVMDFGSGMASSGTMEGFMGSMQSGNVGSMLGSAAGALGSGFMGYGLNNAISGGYKINDLVDGISAIASAIPGIGPIAGAIGGLVNRAFGYKPKQSIGTGISGSIGSSGTNLSAYNAWKQEGGWFRSDRSGRDYTALDASLVESLNKVISGVYENVTTSAQGLGLNTSRVGSFSKNVDVSLTGLSPEDQKKAIETMFVDYSSDLVNYAFASVKGFTRAGEKVVDTLSRLYTSKTSVDTAFKMLGYDTASNIFNAGAVSQSGLLGIPKMVGTVKKSFEELTEFQRTWLANQQSLLVDTFGGIEGFNTTMGKFYDTFYTPQEKVAYALEATTDKLTEAGVKLKAAGINKLPAFGKTIEESRKNYRAMVEDFVKTHDMSIQANKDTYKQIVDAGLLFEDAAQLTLKSAEIGANKTPEPFDASKYIPAVDMYGNLIGGIGIGETGTTAITTAIDNAAYSWDNAATVVSAGADSANSTLSSFSSAMDVMGGVLVNAFSTMGDSANTATANIVGLAEGIGGRDQSGAPAAGTLSGNALAATGSLSTFGSVVNGLATYGSILGGILPGGLVAGITASALSGAAAVAEAKATTDAIAKGIADYGPTFAGGGYTGPGGTTSATGAGIAANPMGADPATAQGQGLGFGGGDGNGGGGGGGGGGGMGGQNGGGVGDAGPQAKGGIQYPNRPYIVGEVGPELVIPNRMGTVVPTHKILQAMSDSKSLDSLTRDAMNSFASVAKPQEVNVNHVMSQANRPTNSYLNQQMENQALSRESQSGASFNSAVVDNSVTTVSNPQTNIVTTSPDVRTNHPIAGVFSRNLVGARY